MLEGTWTSKVPNNMAQSPTIESIGYRVHYLGAILPVLSFLGYCAHFWGILEVAAPFLAVSMNWGFLFEGVLMTRALLLAVRWQGSPASPAARSPSWLRSTGPSRRPYGSFSGGPGDWACNGPCNTAEARKLEYDCPPSPSQRKKENQPKRSQSHVPTFGRLLRLLFGP